MNVLRRLTLSYRLSLLIGIFVLGYVLYAGWSFRTLDQLKVNGPLYQQIMASKDVIADTLPPPLYIIESYMTALQMREAQGDPAAMARLRARLTELRDEFDVRKRYWDAQPLPPQAHQLIAQVHQPAAQFYRVAFAQFIPALGQPDSAELHQALATMAGAFETHRRAVGALVAHAAAQARQAETGAAAQIARETRTLAVTMLATLLLSIGAAYLVRRSIIGPLQEALVLAKRVASGDMSDLEHSHFQDEAGQLLEALDAMRASLRRMLAERSDAELSLRSAKDLTERLIDTASVAIVGLDAHGRVLIFNRAASVLTGYAHEAMLHRVWREAPLFGAQEALVWPATEGWDAVPANIEQVLTTASGSRRCVSWCTTQLGVEGGDVALMCFGIDVTEQRAALAATVQAQQAAEAATRSKSEFLANMSHEIRTPMNAVIGMTRLALKTDLDARQRNYLDKADRAAQGLLGIINDILDFSKIEAGQLQFEQRDIHLAQLLDHLASLTVFRAQDKGLELLFNVDPAVPLVFTGDPLRLGQVLLNLVNNAIKFTDSGEVIVSIRMLAATAASIELEVEVRDTGIGIPDEQAGRLFTAFTQADSSTTRTHGGTGLGLAISRRLVEMMEGRLWLEPKQDRGACFRFTATFAPSPQQPAHMEDVKELASTLADKLADARVLVVDDNAAALEILHGILTSLNMRPVTVSSAQQAMRELEHGQATGAPYRLVLMDWMMPAMDGLAAIRAIRANPRIASTLSIIMVTAYSRDDLLAHAANLDRLPVLDKPVTASNLLDAIVNGLQTAATTPRRLAASTDSQAATPSARAARLLLVEDNEVNQELAVVILTGLGMQVEVAADGSAALQALSASQFDLVLMDCQMPVMDGYEATRRIRANPHWATLPILAMTANAMSGDRARCIEAGMDDHIAKPIDEAELARKVAHWLAARRGAPDLAADRPANSPPPALLPTPAPSPDTRYPALRRAGVDVDSVLGVRSESTFAYDRALRELAQVSVQQIDTALAQGQTERARRHAHHAGALATKIGAATLATTAAELAETLRARTAMAHGAQDADVAVQLERFGTALAAIQDAIRVELAQD